MANEFIARKGLKVLTGGVEVTGSSQFSANVTASGNIKATAFYGDGANVTGVISSSYATTSSVATTSIVTASGVGSTITFTKGDGSSFPVTITVGSSATASYVEYNNVANKPTLVSSSGQIDHDLTTNFVANEHIDHSTVSISAGSGLSGGGDITATRTLTLDTGSTHFTSGVKAKLNADGVYSSSAQLPAGTVSSSLQFNSLTSPFTGSFTGSFTGDGSALTGIATALTISGSSGGTDTVNLKTDTLIFTGNNGITTTVSDNKLTFELPTGTVSSSGQVDVRNTTGIATIATTGSNSFTGVQTITNTTNSTTYTDGALIVQGGVGIAKDVNISGSVNITGLLTVASMSTQYVTSSQYTVGTSRIIVNDDDLVRFAGLSVVDSGSTAGSGSLLWDSVKNHWIYENETGAAYNSAILIAGPKNYGSLGNEEELVAGRIPVATGGDHIDTNPASSSMYIDFTNGKVYVEKGLYVTGSITSSVGFSGNGAGLTNVTAASIDYTNITNKPTLVSASSQIDHDATTNFVANEHIDHSTVSITAGLGLSGGGDITSTRTVTLDTGSAHFTTGVVKALPAGTVSSSLQFNDLASPFTGSFTGSFTGDGSGLTGIATILAVSASDGTVSTGTVNLKTQAITYSAGEGIDLSFTGQTLSISGEDATTTNKGIASFNTNNFTVSSGAVSAKNAIVNGVNVVLGSSVNISLAEITSASATTPDQLILNGGAIIHGVLFTSSSAASLTDGANQVVATLPTGSYDSAMFDYVIKSSGNLRAGTVAAVWQAGTSNIEFTDTSTNDIGNTLNQSFTVDTSGGNARLKFTTTGGGTWTVKTAIRML